MTYQPISPTLASVLRQLEECMDGERQKRTSVRPLCDNEESLRGGGISTPEAQSHNMTRPSARPADPRNGRGLVVRGSVE